MKSFFVFVAHGRFFWKQGQRVASFHLLCCGSGDVRGRGHDGAPSGLTTDSQSGRVHPSLFSSSLDSSKSSGSEEESSVPLKLGTSRVPPPLWQCLSLRRAEWAIVCCSCRHAARSRRPLWVHRDRWRNRKSLHAWDRRLWLVLLFWLMLRLFWTRSFYKCTCQHQLRISWHATGAEALGVNS